MAKLLRQNIGGTDFTMAGCTLTGTCSSAASDYVKAVTLTDGDTLSDGMTVVVAFTNGNTAGTAPALMTIYSSDQINYFSDSGLTQPFTLAPAGCYEITYTGEGNAYTYISYPVMQVGSVSGPLCDASGNKSSGALWLEGDKVSINYSNGCFNVIPQTAGSLTVTTASSVVNGAPVRIGSTVRVLFTQDITGAANTGLVLTYNGVGIPVMAGKNGSLGALLPFDVGGGTYKYLQAYTTLEMTYDGTQFIVLGNPVVISNSDYTVYTDGLNTQSVPRYGCYKGLAVDTFARYVGYSAEKDTNIKDINGNAVYVATFTGTSGAGIHAIQLPSNTDKILDVEGTVVQANGEYITPIVYYYSNVDYSRWYFSTVTKQLVLETGSQNGFGNYVIRVYYTKTSS